MKNHTGKIILSATLFMAGQLTTSAAGIESDSTDVFVPKIHTEMLTTLEPTYTKDVVVGSPWSRNWFVSASAGISAFVGSPLGCEDLFGRILPTLQLTAGKWFTPSIGVRIGYQGFKFTDAAITDHNYHHAHADLMWNVVGADLKDELGLHRWTVAPYIGGGIIHHEDNGKVPFSINYGVMAAYRFNPRLSVNMELAGLNTFRDFDGQGKSNRFGDQMYTISAGLTVNIGKVGWKHAIDAHPYRQQNEYLIDYINELLRQQQGKDGGRQLSGKAAANDGSYSGLASLRARLANKDWDGKGELPSDDNATDTIAGQSSAERRLIGMPFYMFFKINSTELTDESQLQNLINIAKVARTYGLAVYVDGAADSATGNEPINASLSEARANYIAGLLREQGVGEDAIHVSAKGGIDRFSPIQRNRHTRIVVRNK